MQLHGDELLLMQPALQIRWTSASALAISPLFVTSTPVKPHSSSVVTAHELLHLPSMRYGIALYAPRLKCSPMRSLRHRTNFQAVFSWP